MGLAEALSYLGLEKVSYPPNARKDVRGEIPVSDMRGILEEDP